MKIVVSVPTTKQLGFDTFKDIFETKVFDSLATIEEIVEWARTKNKEVTIAELTFSNYNP